MSEESDTPERTADEQRQKFGSAGWDAADDDGNEIDQDIPKPDPDKDQG